MEVDPPRPTAAALESPAAREKIKLHGLKRSRVSRAVKALLKHIAIQRAQTNSLIEDDEILYLTLALTKTLQGRKDKPIRLEIPHPIWQFDGAETCLIVKDRKGEGHKAAKQRLREQKIAGLSKVIGVSKLQTKYEAPEAKRELCKSFDLFLADDRILDLLPKALGKTFFRKKKQPVPVRLGESNWGSQIRRATEATYMYKPSGNSLTIRVARSSFSADECTENVLAALTQAMKHVPQQWNGIRAVFLKSAESVALPIFQREPETAVPTRDAEG